MTYKNGKDFLPARLLKELQEYIEGELIYVPKKEKKRARWGEINGTRHLLERRNHEIYRLYKGGLSMYEIVQRYHLSEDSIRKIIVKAKGTVQNA